MVFIRFFSAELPLPCVVPLSECENPEFEVPVFKFDPKVLGSPIDYRHATNIPGISFKFFF